uniref:Uncharacterized protein n=1 Tax=Rhizophora mucronata TaxID=61149 RepID=A0A2P2NQZ3_RHIMU
MLKHIRNQLCRTRTPIQKNNMSLRADH